jgi:hypothetical protein
MKVSVTFNVSDYERYQLAYYNHRQEFSRSDWNANPRKATRAEIVDAIESAWDNEGLVIGDECPNFNDDGTTDPLRSGDNEEDGE